MKINKLYLLGLLATSLLVSSIKCAVIRQEESMVNPSGRPITLITYGERDVTSMSSNLYIAIKKTYDDTGSIDYQSTVSIYKVSTGIPEIFKDTGPAAKTLYDSLEQKYVSQANP